MSNVLVVGAWRNGLDSVTKEIVDEVEERRDKGFRQLSYEAAIVNLIDLMDAQDTIAEELLMQD